MVMVGADEDEVVDVGRAAVARPPDVVGFAAGWVGAAPDAAAVTHDQRTPLAVGGEANAVAHPKRLAIGGEHEPVQVADAGHVSGLRRRERPDAGDVCRSIGVCNHDHLVSHRWWSGPVGSRAENQRGHGIGSALLGCASIGGAVSSPVGAEHPVGLGVDGGGDLGECAVVELGVEHAHVVVHEHSAPGRPLTVESGGEVAIVGVLPHKVGDLSTPGVGRLCRGDPEQSVACDRFYGRALGRVREHINMGAADGARVERCADIGQCFEESAASDGLVGFALGAPGGASNGRRVAEASRAPRHESFERALVLCSSSEPGPNLTFGRAVDVDRRERCRPVREHGSLPIGGKGGLWTGSREAPDPVIGDAVILARCAAKSEQMFE